MMRGKPNIQLLADGVLTLYADADARHVRGIDWSTTEGLTELYELPYRNMRLRSYDTELSGEDVSQITRKACVRVSPSCDTECLAAIDGTLYELTRVDTTDGRWHYLYMTELATDGTATLVKTTSTRSRGESTRTDVPTVVYARKVAPGAKLGNQSGVETAWPTCTLTIRALDYDGETVARMDGREYVVSKVEGEGEWLELSCTGGVPYGR